MGKRVCDPKIVWAEDARHKDEGTIIMLNDEGRILVPCLPPSSMAARGLKNLPPMLDVVGYINMDKRLVIYTATANITNSKLFNIELSLDGKCYNTIYAQNRGLNDIIRHLWIRIMHNSYVEIVFSTPLSLIMQRISLTGEPATNQRHHGLCNVTEFAYCTSNTYIVITADKKCYWAYRRPNETINRFIQLNCTGLITGCMGSSCVCLGDPPPKNNFLNNRLVWANNIFPKNVQIISGTRGESYSYNVFISTKLKPLIQRYFIAPGVQLKQENIQRKSEIIRMKANNALLENVVDAFYGGPKHCYLLTFDAKLFRLGTPVTPTDPGFSSGKNENYRPLATLYSNSYDLIKHDFCLVKHIAEHIEHWTKKTPEIQEIITRQQDQRERINDMGTGYNGRVPLYDEGDTKDPSVDIVIGDDLDGTRMTMKLPNWLLQ